MSPRRTRAFGSAPATLGGHRPPPDPDPVAGSTRGRSGRKARQARPVSCHRPPARAPERPTPPPSACRRTPTARPMPPSPAAAPVPPSTCPRGWRDRCTRATRGTVVQRNTGGCTCRRPASCSAAGTLGDRRPSPDPVAAAMRRRSSRQPQQARPTPPPPGCWRTPTAQPMPPSPAAAPVTPSTCPRDRRDRCTRAARGKVFRRTAGVSPRRTRAFGSAAGRLRSESTVSRVCPPDPLPPGRGAGLAASPTAPAERLPPTPGPRTRTAGPAARQTSSQIVTGPSLTSDTAMSAPNRPVATGTPSACKAAAVAS